MLSTYPLTDILLVSAVLGTGAFLLARGGRAKGRRLAWGRLAVAAVVLTIVFMLVPVERVGGTVRYVQYGWPHFVAQHQIADVLDGTVIDRWHLTVGPLAAYAVANLLFFLSAVAFMAAAGANLERDKKSRAPWWSRRK